MYIEKITFSSDGFQQKIDSAEDCEVVMSITLTFRKQKLFGRT